MPKIIKIPTDIELIVLEILLLEEDIALALGYRPVDNYRNDWFYFKTAKKFNK